MESLRNKVIYQIFPRQYSSKHNFEGVIDDLDRLQKLNVDYIYLLPIHPIGKLARKGSVGSPYSIYDYRSINRDYGTAKDFLKLISECHKRGMKVIMDIVFNHTSRDSILLKESPEWFCYDENGNLKNRVGDWTDIVDFNFEHEETYAYLINTLKMYVQMGVDGFRCDVAFMIPCDFWKIAIQICKEINPDLIFIAESAETFFIKYLKDQKYDVITDSELFNYFDVLYDYDIYIYFQNYINKKGTLRRYIEEVVNQEGRYNKNYCKLRHLENHDCGSAFYMLKDRNKVRNALALQAFLRGMFFLYNGIECLVDHRLDLFEIDEINWDDKDEKMEDLIIKLTSLKKEEVFNDGVFEAFYLNDDAATLKFYNDKEEYYGVFNFDYHKDVNVTLEDGNYLNILTNEYIEVKGQKIKSNQEPIIIKIEK